VSVRKNPFTAAIGLSSLVALIAFLTPSASYGQSRATNVNVVNTPNVSVVNTPNVNVVPRVPFQQAVILNFSGVNQASAGILLPTGMRLVIEYVSALAALSTGTRLTSLQIETSLAGVGIPSVRHYVATIAPPATVPGIGDYFVMSQPMLAYADAPVGIDAFITGGGSGQMNVTLSGYLVPR
jgi:hypothetical protein